MTARAANPFRAAGTFSGVTYVEREADAQLLDEIVENRLYPYFLAPRQSGKSSLISRTMRRLAGDYLCVFIDLSTYTPDSLEDYDQFLTTFGSELIAAVGRDGEISADSNLKRIVKEVAERSDRRVVIFVDEVDQLLPLKFKDSFFGLVRFFFNQRAQDKVLENVQFVLAGAASPTQLISKENQSPFNVGKSIKLEDLTEQQVGMMLAHLSGGDREGSPSVRAQIFGYTKGSVYLTQLLLERLWALAAKRGAAGITPDDVERVVGQVIEKSSDNIHFLNIYSGIAARRELLQAFRDYARGNAVTPGALEYFRNIGIASADGVYRNPIYESVFGPGGPLSLFHDAREAIERAARDGRTTLNLGGQSLTVLSPTVGRLTNLTRLDISDNSLSALPAELCRLRQLEHLNLSRNRLASLPAEIGQLANLKTLDLRHNHLTSIPPELAQLKQLVQLDLRDNPLPIPSEVLALTHSPETITSYYRMAQATAQTHLNEAKVLVVGQGGVGKTSLVRRLVEDAFDPHEGKTEGIDIRRFYVNVDAEWVRLNVWDFGGQEIMHATHQFFLTKRSLYLLVIDARQDQDENRLEYWLKIIQSFGGDSPVIVVGNKIDQQPLDLDRRRLTEKYENIRAFIETSCVSGFGLEALGGAITTEVGRLEHVHDQLPKTWFAVKTRLEEMRQDYIPYSEYVRLCREEHIDDERSQRTLIGFLHDLGVVLNFRDDPRLEDTTILNPEWVTTAVYKILNSLSLYQNKGVLDRRDIGRILDKERYPPDKHLFIMDVMRKFELCFDFEGQRDEKFLIPDLLTREEPSTGNWEDALNFQYHYNVLPSSVISRFIVRIHPYIEGNMIWRTGVVLRDAESRALVRADLEDRKVFILVGGPPNVRRDFLALIRHQFDSIHRTIPGIAVDERVPLPGRPQINLNYRHLLQLELNNITEVIPEGLAERVNVKQLLDGVEPAESRRERYLDRIMADLQASIDQRDEQPDDTGAEERALEELTTIKRFLDRSSEMEARKEVAIYLLLLAVGWILLSVSLTFGWSALEPWKDLIFLGLPLIFYIFPAARHRSLSPQRIYGSITEQKKIENYREAGFDVAKYDRLTRQAGES